MHIPPELKDLSDSEIERLQAELQTLITAAAERVHYAEGRRSQFLAVGAAMVAGGIALFTAVSQINVSSYLDSALTTMSVGLFILGLILWSVFSIQVNRYPWTSATRTWKWFYRDALPRNSDLNIGALEYIFQWDSSSNRIKHEFENQLSEFRKNMIVGLIDRTSNLDQDLQQLYVLHVNEKYKNIFLTHLRTLLNWGILIILFLTGLIPLMKWIVDQSIIANLLCY